MYALLDSEGAVLAYPYSIDNLRTDNPGVSIPDVLADPSEFNMVEVTPVDIEPYDSKEYKVVYGNPVQVDGSWTEVYSLVALTTEEKHNFCEYGSFWASIISSNLYSHMRALAVSDLRVSTLCSELSILCSSASQGNFFPVQFQNCLWDLVENAPLGEGLRVELEGIMASSCLDLVYTLDRP